MQSEITKRSLFQQSRYVHHVFAKDHAYQTCKQARKDLFDCEDPEKSEYYSLERYHINGSRILSRSFHVEKWEDENEPQGETSTPGSGISDSEGMDVDHSSPSAVVEGENDEDGDAGDSEDEDEDREDPSDVAMVPMADMLNARYGSENVSMSLTNSTRAQTEIYPCTGKVILRTNRAENARDQAYKERGTNCMSSFIKLNKSIDRRRRTVQYLRGSPKLRPAPALRTC